MNTAGLPLMDLIPNGNMIHMVSLDGFDAAAYLVPIDRLVGQLVRLSTATQDVENLRMVTRWNLVVLARRLLLGRYPEQIEQLHYFWEAYGTPSEVIRDAAKAARLARDGWSGSLGERPSFSAAHAEFVERLGILEQSDAQGPLGRAIRLSRYQGAHGRNQAILPGESQHVGFPVVFPKAITGISPSAWVHLEDYSYHHESEDTGPVTDSGQRYWQALCEEWRKLHKDLPKFHLHRGLPQSSVRPMNLPEWLGLYVMRHGEATLSSAGLAVALQSLAETQDWPLPAGIGLTGRLEFGSRGRWDDVRVRGVQGLAAKLRAAREAGVFVLFACRGDEPLPVEVVPGVKLVYLDEDTPLNAVLSQVNGVCAELGLTEYRWRWESERMMAASKGSSIVSRSLPDATEKDVCPVGFIGRESVLRQLRDWKTANKSKNVRHSLVLLAKARAGKTTLLSHWLQTDQDSWPRFPVWFSFLRHVSGRDRFTDLREALDRQLRARFLVVSLRPLQESESLPNSLAKVTPVEIDVIVDGLDEADHAEQAAILNFLQRLPGQGCVVIGSQNVNALRYTPAERIIRLGDRSQEGQDDAMSLIRAFARQFQENADECVQSLGQRLGEASLQDQLAARTDNNLWILTDFLRSFLEGSDVRGWPDRLAELHLTHDVKDYCRDRIKQILETYQTTAERDEVETLLTYLAVLEDRPWPVNDVLTLMRIETVPVQKNRWRRLLGQEVQRLLVSDRQMVRLRDGTFGQFLLEDRPDMARDLVQALVEILAPARRVSPSLWAYAAQQAARHLLRDAADDPHLAAELLLDSVWAPARFATLPEEDASAGALLGELAVLKRLAANVRPEELDPVEALLTAVGNWHWAIDQTRRRLHDRIGRCLADWWARLQPTGAPPPWLTRLPVDAPTDKPRMLWPLRHPENPGVVGAAPDRPLSLTGLVCEMPTPAGGRPALILAETTGDLLVAEYDADTGNYSRMRSVPLGVQVVRCLAALGLGKVLVLAEDWFGLPKLLCVDIVSGTQEDYWNALVDADEAGTPLFCDVLSPEEDGHPECVLVVLSRGEKSWLVVLEGGQSTGITDYVGYRDPLVVVFAPNTWVVCVKPSLFPDEGSSYCTFQALEKERVVTQRCFDVFDPENVIPLPVSFSFIIGICPLPGNRFALIAFDKWECILVFSSEAELMGLYPISGGEMACYPIGWHNKLGLILANYEGRGLKCQPLENCEAADITKQIDDLVPGVAARGLSCNGGVGLSDGRTLLVFPSGGLVLEHDGCSVVRVGNPDRFGDEFQILGVHEQGWVLVGEERRGDDWRTSDDDGLPFELFGWFERKGLFQPPHNEEQRQWWLKETNRRYHRFRYLAPPEMDWGDSPSAAPPWSGVWSVDGETFPAYSQNEARSALKGLDLSQESVTCYAYSSDLAAVGYQSRRIEIHSWRASSGQSVLLALAFTQLPPINMAICQRQGSTYLAVQAEELLWFDLTPLQTRPGAT